MWLFAPLCGQEDSTRLARILAYNGTGGRRRNRGCAAGYAIEEVHGRQGSAICRREFIATKRRQKPRIFQQPRGVTKSPRGRFGNFGIVATKRRDKPQKVVAHLGAFLWPRKNSFLAARGDKQFKDTHCVFWWQRKRSFVPLAVFLRPAKDASVTMRGYRTIILRCGGTLRARALELTPMPLALCPMRLAFGTVHLASCRLALGPCRLALGSLPLAARFARYAFQTCPGLVWIPPWRCGFRLCTARYTPRLCRLRFRLSAKDRSSGLRAT